MIVTRFAPSPTGILHVGHVYAALFADVCARQTEGRFLLRFEDIDPVRCCPEFMDDIRHDLRWLGLDWSEPVRCQSHHMEDYQKALDHLDALGVLYPCFCTRREIAAEVARAGHAPHGLDGVLYPGTCRNISATEREERCIRDPFVLRLDVQRALSLSGPLVWYDRGKGEQIAQPELFGDVVLARKDVPTSYHLAVTVDDHLQGVTLVTRGDDLFAATHVHRLLQALLGLDVPVWYHHGLLVDDTGRRYAKRDRSLTVRSLREAGKTPDEVRAMAWPTTQVTSLFP